MTSDRDREFVTLYRDKRFDDQRQWYAQRTAEYERAHDQLLTATAVALFVTAVAGALAAADVAGLRVTWAILAAAASGLASLLGGYDQLLGYEHNAKIYRDAQAGLGQLRATAPWETPDPTHPGDIDTFVTDVETVLQHEINQWGQLTAAYEPPSPDAQDGPDPPA